MQYFRSSRASKPEPSLPEALAELRELLVERELTVVPPPGESHTALLTRFLVARKLNVSKAADFLAADQAWRRDEKVDELREASAVDRKGRPVIIKHFGAQCVLRSMRKHTEVECLCRYNWWLNEQYHTQLITLGATKWSVIVDAKGWYPGLFDKTAYSFLKSAAAIDQHHYPERLAHVIVINAPRLLAACWRVIQRWLDDDTRQKVAIISEGDPNGARARLEELIELSQLPTQYGGTAPPLEPWPERAGFEGRRKRSGKKSVCSDAQKGVGDAE